MKLFVKDTQIRTFGTGMALCGMNARIDAVVERTRIQDTFDGVTLANDVRALMRETVSTGNQGVGFAAYNGNPSITIHASLILERCTASNNGGVGVLADPASIDHGAITSTFVTISNCVVTNNGVGVQGTTFAGSWPAQLITRGNNTVRENGTNSIGTIGRTPASDRAGHEMRTTMKTLVVLVCALLGTSVAGGAPRTFVSATGSDAADCSRGTPCRSFAKALTLTDPSGKVIALTSGTYDPLRSPRPSQLRFLGRARGGDVERSERLA